jgi:hypothetical protein
MWQIVVAGEGGAQFLGGFVNPRTRGRTAFPGVRGTQPSALIAPSFGHAVVGPHRSRPQPRPTTAGSAPRPAPTCRGVDHFLLFDRQAGPVSTTVGFQPRPETPAVTLPGPCQLKTAVSGGLRT